MDFGFRGQGHRNQAIWIVELYLFEKYNILEILLDNNLLHI